MDSCQKHSHFHGNCPDCLAIRRNKERIFTSSSDDIDSNTILGTSIATEIETEVATGIFDSGTPSIDTSSTSGFDSFGGGSTDGGGAGGSW